MIVLLTKVLIVGVILFLSLIFLTIVVPQMLSAPSLEDNIGGALLALLATYGFCAALPSVIKWLRK